MSEAHTSRRPNRSLAEAEAAIEQIRDEDIDLSNIPEVIDWSDSMPSTHVRPVKDQVTLRIDRDVLAWFRLRNEKYQTAINAALREHMERERKAS